MSRIHLLAGAAPCLLLAMPAVAQTQDTSPATDVATAQNWTGDIIVTGAREGYAAPETSAATRTSTPLIHVPQSVQVLNRTLIQEQDRRTLGDTLVNVSGVTPTRSDEVLFIPPIVRGFPAEVYLDGLSVFAGNQQAYDPNSLVGIERIDVLKGPTATLYGGGIGTPLGGVINLESVRPNDKAGGYLAMRAGSFSTWNPYGDINVPLANGIAARITGEYQSNDSWIDKVKARRWSVQPGVSFQIDPATDLLLQGQFSRRSNLEYSGLPADAALAGTIDRNAFPGSPIDQPLTTNDIRMGQAMLRHAFSDRLKLTAGSRVLDVPRWTWNARGTYDAALTDRLRGNLFTAVRHVGSSNSGFGEGEVLPRPAYTLVDASAGVRTGNGMGIDLFVTNLFDVVPVFGQEFTTSPGNTTATSYFSYLVGPPRTIGIRLTKAL